MSLRKDTFSWAFVGFGVLLVLAAAFYVIGPQMKPRTTVRLGDGVFSAQIAKTEEERTKGLSGTDKLDEGKALLFVFDREEKWPIWMKDMRYAIDIVWLDKNKKVVHIVKNAPPESYPNQRFTPSDPALYVLELQAGMVEKKAISVDDTAVFDEHSTENWL